jgi:hypothetical protein
VSVAFSPHQRRREEKVFSAKKRSKRKKIKKKIQMRMFSDVIEPPLATITCVAHSKKNTTSM